MPSPAMSPQMLQMLIAAAKQKQAQIALTPNDMSPADKEQKAMGLGLLDPTQPVQGGVDQPGNILTPPPPSAATTATPAETAAAAAEAARAKGSMPAPAPAPVAPGGQLGPGVTMDPNVTIRPSSEPQAVLENKPSRSDQPDPHAPEPQDEDPDGEDDGDEDDIGFYMPGMV